MDTNTFPISLIQILQRCKKHIFRPEQAFIWLNLQLSRHHYNARPNMVTLELSRVHLNGVNDFKLVQSMNNHKTKIFFDIKLGAL